MKTLPPTVTAVILAGGLGTRIREQLPDLPKPLAPVAGRPFLEWQLRYLAHQGLRRAVLATGYLGEKVAAFAKSVVIDGLELAWVAEPEPLGTAGAFYHAVQGQSPEFGDQTTAWLVLNGDSLIVADYGGLVEVVEKKGMDGAILGVAVEDAGRYGSLVEDGTGRLKRFAEKQAGAGTINSGVYLIGDRLLNHFPTQRPLSFEYDVFPHWLKADISLGIETVNAPFLDIGTPETLTQADGFVRQQLAPLLSLA